MSSLSEKELLEKEAKYCSWGDTVHYLNPPKFFESCEDSFLYDKEGHKFLDLQMWYSAASFGYANKRLNEALKKQIDKLPQLACQYVHSEKIELAEKIAKSMEATFKEAGRVHFNVGGAQAVEDSLKLVRQHTRKNLVFAFMGSYHGRTLAASEITSSYRYRQRYGHFSNKAHFVPYPYCFRCPYGKTYPSCDMYCAQQFEKLFETEYNGVWDVKSQESEYGAFYVEAVQGTGGYIIPPKEYFPYIKKVLDRYKILLVDDEIQMGFFRTGKLWAMSNFDVTPDIVIFGKALTNGLNPLSGIWAKEGLINPKVFPAGSTHSTFSSNTLGTAVGLEVMKMIESSDYGKMIQDKGKSFLGRLQTLQKKYPKVIGHVDGIGMAFRMEICKEDGYTPDRELTDRIFAGGIEGNIPSSEGPMGLVLDVGGYYKNVFTIAPCFNITEKQMDLAIELMDGLIKRVLKR